MAELAIKEEAVDGDFDGSRKKRAPYARARKLITWDSKLYLLFQASS